MSKDRLIVSQVAFKGAIDLAVSGKIQVEDISEAYKSFAEDIWAEYGTVAYTNEVGVAKVVSKPSDNLQCPHCQSKVYDNRNTKTKPTQPNFKCGSQDCGGGKEYQGKIGAWASWSDEPTADMLPHFKAVIEPIAKDINNIDDNTPPF